MVAAPINELPAAEFLEYLEWNNSSSGASANWLVEEIQSWEADEGYADLATRYQQRLVQKEAPAEDKEQREALMHIKRVFSLNAQQLAEIMQVSRAALYKWLDGETRMREENFKRLQALGALAKAWEEATGKPMRRTRGLNREAHAELLEALCMKGQEAFEAAEAKARSLMEELAPRQRSRKSLTEIAKERQWEPLPEHVVRGNLDGAIPSVRVADEED